MKKLLIVVLSISFIIQGYSQDSRRYSKKELKEIIRAQQRKIGDLMAKNDELLQITSRFHTIEQDMFKYLAQKNDLEKTLIEKENELITKVEKKSYLLIQLLDIKRK